MVLFCVQNEIFLEKLRSKRRTTKCESRNSFHKNKNSSKRSRFYDAKHSNRRDLNNHEYDSGHQLHINKETKYYRDGSFIGPNAEILRLYPKFDAVSGFPDIPDVVTDMQVTTKSLFADVVRTKVMAEDVGVAAGFSS